MVATSLRTTKKRDGLPWKAHPSHSPVRRRARYGEYTTMTQTTYTDNVEIDGSRDVVQLTVKAAPNQGVSLQRWLDANGNPFVSLDSDGSLLIAGSDHTSVTVSLRPDGPGLLRVKDDTRVALIIQAGTPTSTTPKPLQEWQDAAGNVLAVILNNGEYQLYGPPPGPTPTDVPPAARIAPDGTSTFKAVTINDANKHSIASIVGTGAATVQAFKLPTGAAQGKLLTCDDQGNAVWIPRIYNRMLTYGPAS